MVRLPVLIQVMTSIRCWNPKVYKQRRRRLARESRWAQHIAVTEKVIDDGQLSLPRSFSPYHRLHQAEGFADRVTMEIKLPIEFFHRLSYLFINKGKDGNQIRNNSKIFSTWGCYFEPIVSGDINPIAVLLSSARVLDRTAGKQYISNSFTGGASAKWSKYSRFKITCQLWNYYWRREIRLSGWKSGTKMMGTRCHRNGLPECGSKRRQDCMTTGSWWDGADDRW